MSSLSVVILVKNEASKIESCLQRLGFADEIVLYDTGSTDETLSLAQRTADELKVRLVVAKEERWEGFGAARVKAQAHAGCDWVLMLDSDEWVEPELAQKIQVVVKENHPQEAYRLPRSLDFFLGRLRWGGSYPDYVTRLYRPRDGAHFDENDRVHESLKLPPSVTLKTLKSPLIHRSFDSVSHFFQKQLFYASLWSEVRRHRSRPVRRLSTAFGHALGDFLKRYLLRLGFLDGRAGLLFAACYGCTTFMKYLIAYDAHRIKGSKPSS